MIHPPHHLMSENESPFRKRQLGEFKVICFVWLSHSSIRKRCDRVANAPQSNSRVKEEKITSQEKKRKKKKKRHCIFFSINSML